MVLPKPQLPTLPPELVLVIIELLSGRDQKKFCLASRTYRQLTLPALFRRLIFSWDVQKYIKWFNEAARADVKAAVRFVFQLSFYFMLIRDRLHESGN
jgi:hypothetical protein